MSSRRHRLMGCTICLTAFCLTSALLAAAAGRTDIRGAWKLNELESDELGRNVAQITGSPTHLSDSVTGQPDQHETATGMSYDRILLMMGGISSPPQKLAVALNDSDITLSDAQGVSLTLHTDGRSEE